LEILFWLSLLGVVYSYVLYPFVLMMLPMRRRVGAADEGSPSQVPQMTVIITVHNEEARIVRKLANTLGLTFPEGALEILVASDCSTDGTDALVESYGERGVRLIRAPERRGKEFAQSLALASATGEIVVFSDVATVIPPDGLLRIAGAFRDPAVGAVSSEDRIVAPSGQIVGEGLYIRYEMWLRRLETRVKSLVGLSGSFFAARRSVCADWDPRLPGDFNTALNCVRAGYVAVSDPAVVGVYSSIQDESLEYNRKLRTVLQGITTVWYRREFLNPVRHGLFAFQLWSHKILRWMVPWFLLIHLGSAAWLAAGGSALYAGALVGQMIFYMVVLAGQLSSRLRMRTLVRIPWFFIQANAAIAHATMAFLVGRRMDIWQPSKR